MKVYFNKKIFLCNLKFSFDLFNLGTFRDDLSIVLVFSKDRGRTNNEARLILNLTAGLDSRVNPRSGFRDLGFRLKRFFHNEKERMKSRLG